MNAAEFPKPAVADDAAGEFWALLRAGEFCLQRCAACGVYRHPPTPICAVCRSSESEWVPASGRGEIWSYTIIHSPVLPAFVDRVPYNAVVVRLDEGVFMVSNLLDELVSSPIGRRVLAVLTRVDDELTLPQFRLSA
jgi:uncharacterized OB-fold protein